MDDEDPAASGADLFLLPRGRPRPRGAVGTPRFRQDPSASAIEASWEKKKPWMKKKMMWQRWRNLFRVFTHAKGALFISTY
jgi:hypothetical protein